MKKKTAGFYHHLTHSVQLPKLQTKIKATKVSVLQRSDLTMRAAALRVLPVSAQRLNAPRDIPDTGEREHRRKGAHAYTEPSQGLSNYGGHVVSFPIEVGMSKQQTQAQEAVGHAPFTPANHFHPSA